MASNPLLNKYLDDISGQLELPQIEKDKIESSLKNIREKLIVEFFDHGLEDIRPFGSFDRGTLLSRKIDSESDVDLLIMFDQKKWEVQTYLNKLKKFADTNYQRSDIFQDHPTIVVNLSHIKFELTPCVYTKESSAYYETFVVPQKDGENVKWIKTKPFEIKASIHKLNNTRATLLKLIRLFKYWNLTNQFTYKTFEVEKFVVTHFDYEEDITYNFFKVIKKLNYDNSKNQNELNKITKGIAENVQYLLERNMGDYALQELKKIIPEIL